MESAVVTIEMTRTVWACCGVTPGANSPPMTAAACLMRGSLGTVVVGVSGMVVVVTTDVVVSIGIAVACVVLGIGALVVGW